MCEPPVRQNLAVFPEGFAQRFIVTIDAEEEFDWSKPLSREGHSLRTIPMLRKFQQFCEGYGVSPIYLLDYPVATSKLAADMLSAPVAAGRAELGVQLHPWVSPPHVEEVSPRNSFAGNLPPELEREKFIRLRDTIEQNFKAPARIYRAGRYGLGPNSAEILRDSGMAIDSSVRARFDYSSEFGPNYRDHPIRPYWVDRPGGLLELPLTTVYWGALRQAGHFLYPRLWRVPWLRGALARVGLLDRIPLTPEGVTAREALRGIDVAVAERLPILVFSFHSPSLLPGYSPYIRSEDELDGFYDWWRQVFTALQEHGVRPTTVAEIMDSVRLA